MTTLVETIGLVSDLARYVFWPVRAVLSLFNISPKPDISCELSALSNVRGLPGATVFVASVTLRRRRWLGDIEDVKNCRIVFRWRPASAPDRENEWDRVNGQWLDPTGRYAEEHTLVEGDPYFIPMFMVVHRSGEIRNAKPNRVYVADRVLTANGPENLLHSLDAGEHRFELILRSRGRIRTSIPLIISVSYIASRISIETSLVTSSVITGIIVNWSPDGAVLSRSQPAPLIYADASFQNTGSIPSSYIS